MSDVPPMPRIPMGPSDDRDQWMAHVTSLSDHDIDELIAGRTPEGMHELSPVAQVSLALRERTAFETAPAMGPSLRQALADAPALTARNTGRIRRRLSGMAAVGVGALAFGAATAANALVSEAGDVVGLELPHSDDRAHDGAENESGPEATTPDDDLGHGDDTSTDLGPGAIDEGQPSSADVGPPPSTPAGTTPADPGTPRDQAPATPAVPSASSHGLEPDDTAPGNGHPTGPAAHDQGAPTVTGAPIDASAGRPPR